MIPIEGVRFTQFPLINIVRYAKANIYHRQGLIDRVSVSFLFFLIDDGSRLKRITHVYELHNTDAIIAPKLQSSPIIRFHRIKNIRSRWPRRDPRTR